VIAANPRSCFTLHFALKSALLTLHSSLRGLSSAAWGLAVIFLGVFISSMSVTRSTASESSSVPVRSTFILVVGAPGDKEYGSNFLRQAELWQNACSKVDCRKVVIGLNDRESAAEEQSTQATKQAQKQSNSPAVKTTNTPNITDPETTTTIPSTVFSLSSSAGAGRGEEAATNSNTDLALLQRALEQEPKEGPAELWVVLIGHGTFDSKEARFNLRGPDVSASDLDVWLKPFHRPIVVINTASSSSPFLNKLSATNRVIITATRSGNEQNFARFGQYFAEAITSTNEADLDKDGQVSVLESFLIASRKAAEFYKLEGRLVTEHALIDDNGDGLGTPADWFRGLRAVKKPQGKTIVDGLLAQQICIVPSREEASLSPEQRAKRDGLERQILLFREKKSSMPEADYYGQLEKLLLDYARFYQSLPGVKGERAAPDS